MALTPAQTLQTLSSVLSGAEAKGIEIRTGEQALRVLVDLAPGLELGVDSLMLLIDFLMLLKAHTAKHAGRAQLPGPELNVPYPAKW